MELEINNKTYHVFLNKTWKIYHLTNSKEMIKIWQDTPNKGHYITSFITIYIDSIVVNEEAKAIYFVTYLPDRTTQWHTATYDSIETHTI